MEEFESILQGLWQTKPPGVSGSKIQRLTQIAVQNVKESGKIAMFLYKHFKKTSGSHKLGVLYVVDSVARAYQDLARDDNTTLEDGTFAGGLHQLTQLLESLMNDIMLYAPNEHREKVRKLLNIWEKAATFPSELLLRLRNTHFADEESQGSQTGSMGAHQSLFGGQGESTELVNRMGSSNTIPNQTESLVGQTSQSALLFSSSSESGASNVSVSPVILQALAQMSQQMQNGQQTMQQIIGAGGASSEALGGLDGASSLPFVPNNSRVNTYCPSLPSQAMNLHTSTPSVGHMSYSRHSSDVLQAQQAALLQLLTQQGVSAAQIQSIIQYVQSRPSNETLSTLRFNNTQSTIGNMLPAFQPVDKAQQYSSVAQHPVAHSSHSSVSGQHLMETRTDQGGSSEGLTSRSLTDLQSQNRSRLLSKRKELRDSLTRPTRSEDHGKSKSMHRQRSERSISPSTRVRTEAPAMRPARVGSHERTSTNTLTSSEMPHTLSQSSHPRHYVRDSSVPDDSIKVLSRTLFVGGISQSISQEELIRMFSAYGNIQSCIVNYNARHAFIKMYTRKDAEAARTGMDAFTHGDNIIRTKWGVGFGPRDCSNYTIGISVIPMRRLTDVDRRWCMCAEWGGTGGLPVEGGFVMEEPDIEITATVSSKATNKRVMSSRNEHKKDSTNQQQQTQQTQTQTQTQTQQPLQLQQNCYPVSQNASQPSSTLVSPWIGAIQTHNTYKMS